MTSIGVIGHRSFVDSEAVLKGIDLALETIRGAFPGPYLLHTSLAEGADRMVARRALLSLHASLVVPLPLALADYMCDFSRLSQDELGLFLQQAEEILELPPQSSRTAAYEAAGRYILGHIQVLVTVWDGQPARGPGGTGQMVAEAREMGLPLAWVPAGDRDPACPAPTRRGTFNRQVRYERFPTGPDG
jgi:hypothetical protein